MINSDAGIDESPAFVLVELFLLSAFVVLFRRQTVFMVVSLAALLASYTLAYFRMLEQQSRVPPTKSWMPQTSWRVSLFLIGAIISFEFGYWLRDPRFCYPLITLMVAMGVFGNGAAVAILVQLMRAPRIRTAPSPVD